VRSPTNESLGDQAAGGVLWGVAQKWTQRLAGFATVAILARLLRPDEFGLVAMATAFVPIVYLLADLGFSTYIVQSHDTGNEVVSTAFWFSTTAGLTLCGLTFAAAPLVEATLHVSGVSAVIAGLAPTIALVGFSSVPISLLRRRMAFRELAIQSSVASVIGQVAAVVLAFGGAGVWALVVQSFVVQLVSAILAWRTAHFRPSRTFSRRHFVEMTKFGTRVTAVEFVAVLRLWAETAIITAVLGVTGLGYLNVAQRLVQTAQDLSSAAVVPVSTVLFAQLRDITQRLTSAYVRALETVYVVVMPVMIGLSVAAPVVVPIAFGSQWGDSVTPVRALAVAAIFTLGATLDNGLYYGLGKPGRWLWYAIVVDGLTVATTAVTVHYGLVGVSVGFIGVAAVATVVRWFLVRRLLQTTWFVVARPLLVTAPPALLSACAGLLSLRLTNGLPNIVALAIIAVFVAGTHVLSVRLLAPKLFTSTGQMLTRRLPWPKAVAKQPGDAPVTESQPD